MKIKVQVYEDNDEIREGLSMLLSYNPDFELTGSYNNASKILQNYEEHFPDILLMDIEMPETNGLEGLSILKAKYPEAVVIILTVFDDNKNLFDALCRGASGYILKHISPERLPESIKEAFEGGAPMSPGIARRVIGQFAVPASKNDYSLSPREKEILAHLVDGNSYKMIAAKSEISIETVKTHMKKIYEKMHVRSQSEAVAKALKDRIV